jgi:hypothetical protein
MLPCNTTLAVGSAAAYKQPRTVQTTALAAEDAEQVTNAIDIIKERHLNTRTFGNDASGNPVVGDLIVHSLTRKAAALAGRAS